MATTDVRAVATRAFKQWQRDKYRGTLPGAGGVNLAQIPLLTPGYFRIGTGGFQLATSGAGTLKVPKNPDNGNGYSTLTKLDSDTLSVFAFSKALQVGDFTTEGTDQLTLNVRCQLLASEALNTPAYEFFEIGLFIPSNATTDPYAGVGNDLMVAYGTFPKEVQTGATFTHHVKIAF